MQVDIEHHYNELKKKFSLPAFGAIDREFDVAAIEKPVWLLRDIVRKIAERFDSICQIVELWVQPDAASFVSLHEYRSFSEEERKLVLKQFQALMALHRSCLAAELGGEDKNLAAVISRVAAEWPGISSALLPLVQKLSGAWPKPMDHKEVVGYFG